MTTTQEAGAPAAIPGLAAISPDKLAALGNTALAAAIRLYRERAEAGSPPAPFNSAI